jgi:hypothetical protein
MASLKNNSTAAYCIAMFVILSVAAAKHDIKSPSSCKHRSHHYLDKRLLELRTQYDNEQQAKMRGSSKTGMNEVNDDNAATYSSASMSQELERLFDETGCHLEKKSAVDKTRQSSQRQKTTCPSTVVMREREQSWPRRVAEIKCTCSRCNLPGDFKLSTSVYRCMPVLVPKPMLLREDKCDAEGFHMWSDSVEMVNMGCTCGFHD